MPDDNSAQNNGMEYWAGFGQSVNNNCLNNHQLADLLTLSLFQYIELWVFPDDNSVQKQGVEDIGGIWLIITVSPIRNWHLCEI